MDLKDFEKQTFLYKANLDLDGIVYTSKQSFNTYQEAWRYCIEHSPENEFCEFFVTQFPSLEIISNPDVNKIMLENYKKELNDSKAE